MQKEAVPSGLPTAGPEEWVRQWVLYGSGPRRAGMPVGTLRPVRRGASRAQAQGAARAPRGGQCGRVALLAEKVLQESNIVPSKVERILLAVLTAVGVPRLGASGTLQSLDQLDGLLELEGPCRALTSLMACSSSRGA